MIMLVMKKAATAIRERLLGTVFAVAAQIVRGGNLLNGGCR